MTLTGLQLSMQLERKVTRRSINVPQNRFPVLFRIIVVSFFGFFIFASPSPANHLLPKITDTIQHPDSSFSEKNFFSLKTGLYDSLQLENLGLSHEAFVFALQGFYKLKTTGKLQNDSILSVIDFSLPSSRKRLFLINLTKGSLLFNTLVSHGKKSGRETATSFSNQFNSYKSSLGFYITGSPYTGKHGCSLRLEGEEKGINDNAFNRGIVMHSAAYVNEQVISSQGYIGRSEGCPAIPQAVHKMIIEKIKNGSCLYIYSPDKFYVSHSKMINGDV
jgi:hypothetical protein